MADMKKIIDDIMFEANDEARKIIADAKNEAEKIIAEAKSECFAIEKEEQKRKAVELSRLERRYASARASQRRTMLLKAKQEIINTAVNDAYKSVTSLSGTDYEKILLKLFTSHMREGECTIYFPSSYKPSRNLLDKLKKLANEKHCNYNVSYDRKGVENGFIMVYGGIEENCTFHSLFEEKRDEIFELAAAEILGTEEGA